MTKSPFVAGALLSTLAVATAGCAHQPPAASATPATPAALAGEVNVMQLASSMGYNTPKVIDGRTLYCQPEELTGSLIPKVACIDADQVVSMARSQGDEIKYLLKPPNAVTRPGS